MRRWIAIGLLLVFVMAPLAQAQDILTGLKLYLNCNEASGNALDSSGLGNTATATNGPTRVAGQTNFGNACFCNGVNQYFIVANEATFDFNFNLPFTVAAWLKPTTTDTTVQSIVVKSVDGGNYTGWHWITNLAYDTGAAGKMTFLLWNTPSIGIAVSTPTATLLNDTNWHHYAWTYSGAGNAAGVIFYQDGSAVTLTPNMNSLAGNSILNNQAVGVCARSDGAPTNAEFYNGAMDEIRIFDRALLPTEISFLATCTPPCTLAAGTSKRSVVY